MNGSINRRVVVLLGSLAFLLVVGTQRVSAHHPDDPVVREMVKRAVEYLDRYPLQSWRHETLTGYALIKAGVPKDHPRLVQSVETVVKQIRAGVGKQDPPYVYPLTLAILLLTEYDPEAYVPELEQLVAALAERQVATGGFAYPNIQLADISQTQYAILGFWTADKYGIKVDPEIGRKAMLYMMDNQDERGGYSYQGRVQGDTTMTLSMSAGGAGTLYIGATWLGYNEDADRALARRPEEEGLPPDVRLVLDEAPGTGGGGARPRKKAVLDEARLRNSQERANTFLKNAFEIRVRQWQYYYLYSYERYASFYEFAKGINEREPEWYNQGVEFMRSQQLEDGAFPDDLDEAGARDVSTSFAILFLVRSTKKSLGEAEWRDGRLLGGQGLSDEARTIMKGGRVVSLSVGRDVDDLMGLIEASEGSEDLSAVESIDLLTIDDSNPELRDRQLAAVRNLVSHPTAQVRYLAVRALGDYQSLENIPPLIYSLTDPQEEIVQFANESLLRIARKFDDRDFTLKANFNETDVENLRERWIQWYFSVQPDGKLFRPVAR